MSSHRWLCPLYSRSRTLCVERLQRDLVTIGYLLAKDVDAEEKVLSGRTRGTVHRFEEEEWAHL